MEQCKLPKHDGRIEPSRRPQVPYPNLTRPYCFVLHLKWKHLLEIKHLKTNSSYIKAEIIGVNIYSSDEAS